MFTTREINAGCNPVEAFSQCQSNTMPVQGRYGYAADVKLPHQMLYGVMPQLKEESQTLIHALSLSSTRGAYDLAVNWRVWQPFVSGVHLHELHPETALCDLLDLPLSSNKQQLAMYTMQSAVVSTINEQLNKHKYKAFNWLIKQGLIANKDTLEFISSTFSYSVMFDIEGESHYGSYDDVGLKLSDENGMAVVDLDFSSLPLPLKHYSHALVHLLANLTCSLWSADLAVAGFGYNDLYDVLLDVTSFEERVALRKLASKVVDEDKFKAVLKEQYDALYSEILIFDEDFDWSYSLLMDLLSFDFDFDFGNDYQAFVDPSDLKSSAANLLTELTALGVSSKSISRHPHYNKVKLVTQLLSDNIHAVESSSFNNCSDIYLPETRVISVDISNDNSAINSINSMQCDSGESAAFTVDLTDNNAIKNLENIWLGNAVLAFL